SMTDDTQQAEPEPAHEEPTLHIDPYERNWIRVAIATLAIFMVAVTVAGFALGIQVPTDEGRIDPNTLDQTPPWSEPGLRTIVEGEEYEAYIIATRYQFDPREIRVPVGAKVTFYVTSNDVQHAFKISDTNINMMVIPGQISKLSATFSEPGTYDYICFEYCGLGHAIMFGQLIVEAAEGGE
ncbi:MAG: cytochrome c oxidase subunit II, partial [Actinomycetota bacterium]